jgi:hypothetical protein
MVLVINKACAGYAWECVCLPALTDDPEIREQLLAIARNWMREGSAISA